jgi:hypothetical protein
MSSEKELPIQVDIENLIERYKSILVNGNLSERERLLYTYAIKKKCVIWSDVKDRFTVYDTDVVPDMLDDRFTCGTYIVTCEEDTIQYQVFKCIKFLTRILNGGCLDLIVSNEDIKIYHDPEDYVMDIHYDKKRTPKPSRKLKPSEF